MVINTIAGEVMVSPVDEINFLKRLFLALQLADNHLVGVRVDWWEGSVVEAVKEVVHGLVLLLWHRCRAHHLINRVFFVK